MTDQAPSPRMRPFFPTVQDFAAATAPHFGFLVGEFGFVGPSIEEQSDVMYDVVYYGPSTAVLLNWDTTGSFFACNLAPRLADGTLDPDYQHWLSVNEVVAVRGGADRWVGAAALDDVDLHGYGAVMKREASNLREFCADVLRGDWRIRSEAHRWLEQGPHH
jgi:hypothetical protein